MCSYLDLVRLTTARFHDQLKSVCAPLFEAFGLNHFWYYKISENGGFYFLDSNISWCEYYGGEKLYLQHPYLRHPKFLCEGIYVLQNRCLYSSQLEMKLFGFQTNFQVVDKVMGGIEAFGFSSPHSNESQMALLVNEIKSIKIFTDRFKSEHRKMIAHLEDNQIDLVGLIGSSFYKNENFPFINSSARQVFLKKMGVASQYKLSPREIDVLKLMLEGYSASQIASLTSRSKRTIEHHIERIKWKTSSLSKGELIRKVGKLEQLNGCL